MNPNRRSMLIGAVLGVSAPAHAARTAVARTRHGAVRGHGEDGVLAFRGIRYAAPPRRFMAPEAPARWDDVRDASRFGAASPQRGDEPDQSEDCLFLNVWTPGLEARAKRPVLVYVHGGAYATGSGSGPMLNGAGLARRGDAVVVTLNHRLNIFGYAYLARLSPAFPDSGNAGQLDLVRALQWVRDNIAAFGGDPGCVTLFGQSGGGAKIATLMATPAAAGLFHRAITMSGQQVTASGPLNATTRARTLLQTLGVDDPAALVDMAVGRLLDALRAEDPVLGYGGLYFGPVVDGRTLHRHPFYPDAAPQSSGVPMMIGNTHDETRAFLGGDPRNFMLTWEALPSRLTLANMRVDIAPERVVEAYRRFYPHYSPSDVLFSATTAARSWRAALIELEARAAAGAPAWAYQLDWRSPREGGRHGAHHGLDIPLVFGALAASGEMTGVGADARRVSATMMDAFIAFARTGVAGWPAYTLPRRQTQVFDVNPRVVDDPRSAERVFFAQVPYVQPGT